MTSAPMNRLAMRELACDRNGGHPVGEPIEHLDAVLAWICRAQDGTPDAGVCRAYGLAWNAYFGGRGWQASYPETTGYIIPTLLEAADCLDRPALRGRALRMADWEIDVQLGSGAVMGGILGQQDEPSPAIFNTGQVILGWLAAHRATGDARYLSAATRAGDYLLEAQEPDGSFSKGRSEFARRDCTTYYTRVAWPLCALGAEASESRYSDAGRRGIDYALTKQLPNGWFADNCLDDPERPLLHTIAYAMRGTLEAGLLLGEDAYVEAAAATAHSLAERQRASGGLSGRFDRDWSEAADWECLTGNAQTAIVWSKLAARSDDDTLQQRAQQICRFLMSTQNLTSDDPGLRGGIKGSFPVDGEYGRFELLNWAAKFFADALLLTLPLDHLSRRAEVTS
jgi:hypothetical protein